MLQRASDPEVGRARRLAAAVALLSVAAALAHRNGLDLPRLSGALDALRPAAAAAAALRDGVATVDPRLRTAERALAEATARRALAEARAAEAGGRLAALERTAGIAPAAAPGWRMVRVIGVLPEPAGGRSALLDAGRDDGVRVGAAVLVAGEAPGILGRVSEAGRRTARVLLVDDAEARIAATVSGVDAAVYEGGWPEAGHLRYVTRDSRIRPGDEVATSSAGTIYPAGLPIGRVSSVEAPEEGPFLAVRVAPYARPAAARYALVEVRS